MALLQQSRMLTENLFEQGKLLLKEKSMDEAGIDTVWIMIYALIAKRVDLNRRHGLKCYPYEPAHFSRPSWGGFRSQLFSHAARAQKSKLYERDRHV